MAGLIIKNFSQNVLVLLLLSLILINFSCRDNPTGSQANEPQPGRRDYVWTLDTLNMPVNYLSAIWGATPSDVWAVGPGGTYSNRLQHFDGKKWSAYNKEPILCEGRALYGFGENDIWMGGESDATPGATIWHYDENQWTQNYNYNVAGAYSVDIRDIWGLRSNNVFACGIISYPGSYPGGLADSLQGFVLHFDGSEWKEVAKGDLNYQFLTIRSECTTSNILLNQDYESYIFGYKLSNISDDSAIVAFYELDGNKLNKIYSNKVGKIYWGGISEIDNQVYFLISQDVYKYINGSLAKQFGLSNPNFGYQLWGRNPEDIFVRMTDGIAHYDGTDIEYLYKFPPTLSETESPTIFQNDVFFCIWDESGPQIVNEILHGKLNN
jgi:hypothetical protein